MTVVFIYTLFSVLLKCGEYLKRETELTTKYVTSEQQVYHEGNYLYFENEILTTVQN